MPEKLKFYDVGKRKSFTSTKWVKKKKSGRMFAVTKSKFGNYDVYRILGKA